MFCFVFFDGRGGGEEERLLAVHLSFRASRVPIEEPHTAPFAQVPPVPPPIHGLLRTALIVFSQLSSGEDVCRTCLLSVAAIAARGVGVLAAVSAELLLFLHREGPVLGEVWMPVTPVLETTPSPKPCVVELLQRLRVSRP